LNLNLNLAEAPAELSAAAAMIWAWAVTFVPRLGAALIILIVGFMLAGWASRLVRGIVARSRHIDDTLEPILGTTARYAVLILFIVAALGQIGVQTASLLAVLGAAGLAIGLALQGTLQNIAAGIMLIYLRPFRVGDTIETPTVAGTVKEIGLFVTHLDTGDGLFFFAPNSEIWNKPLKNYSRNPRRLMTVQIGISYGSDPAKARRVLLDLAAADPRVLTEPAPQVFVEKYGESAVALSFQAWAPTASFLDVQRAMIEEAKQHLEAAGIEIPFPQRIVLMGPGPGREGKAQH
jgi:small conductance mechanosensitive channel